MVKPLTIEKPAIGTMVEVTTDYSSTMKGFDKGVRRVHTKVGKVVAKGDWEDDDVFCILTADPKMPVRSVKLQYVSRIHVLGEDAPLALDKLFTANVAESEAAAVNFEITGSKGNVYIVTKDKFSWSCTCPAGTNKKTCKHVTEAKAKFAATKA